jgi:hypothetical protein
VWTGRSHLGCPVTFTDGAVDILYTARRCPWRCPLVECHVPPWHLPAGCTISSLTGPVFGLLCRTGSFSSLVKGHRSYIKTVHSTWIPIAITKAAMTFFVATGRDLHKLRSCSVESVLTSRPTVGRIVSPFVPDPAGSKYLVSVLILHQDR